MSKFIIIEGNSNDKDNVRTFMVKGERGYGIASIEKTSSTSAVDIYTITLEDGSTSTFEVPNGNNFYTKAETDQEIQEAIDSLGTIFNLKGYVATVQDLPSTGNTVGDVYYVQSESAGFIWINDAGTLRWEELGMTVDNLYAKEYTVTLVASNWTLNSTTNNYEYDISNTEITVNHLVNIYMDLENQAKMTGSAYTQSYAGGFKIITNEAPTQSITATITYELTESVSV